MSSGNDLLQELLSLGFTTNQAKEALEKTKKLTITNAVNYIVSAYDEVDSDLKMVFVVNTRLGMKSGKVIAQCCHAYDGILEGVMQKRPNLLEKWRFWGSKKIVLKLDNDLTLTDLQSIAESYNIFNYLVTDAGHTQVPAGSKTVLALGPDESCKIDEITGKLRLY